MAIDSELESGEPSQTAHPNTQNETNEPRVLLSFLREHISWTADDSGEESENKCTYMSMAAFRDHLMKALHRLLFL